MKNLMKLICFENPAKFVWHEGKENNEIIKQTEIKTSPVDKKIEELLLGMNSPDKIAFLEAQLAKAREEALKINGEYFKEIEPIVDALAEQLMDIYSDQPASHKSVSKDHDEILEYLKSHCTAQDLEGLATFWKNSKDIIKNRYVCENEITGASLIEHFKNYLKIERSEHHYDDADYQKESEEIEKVFSMLYDAIEDRKNNLL